ncbi:MAG: sigma 54-interacting transcriptional regulator [Gammaproteobacteria bacterium]|nr:sigma 54-interacting transcriptional regulator [Gammaproteobacteria bacterium]
MRSDDNFNTDGLFRRIAEATAAATGGDFLQALLAPLAEVLHVRYVFIASFSADCTRARVLAWWDGERYAADIEYALAGTPCATVLDGEVHCYHDGVAALFPDEPELADLGIRSYMAVPLLDRGRRVLGHLAIMDTRPMSHTPRDIAVFRIFGARAGAELLRLRAEEALKASERSLANVIASAPDGIVTLNAGLVVDTFNPAAEAIFRCTVEQARGLSFSRYASRDWHDALQAASGASRGGAPSLHTGRRHDGSEFAVEWTIAVLEPPHEGRRVLIVRDVEERERARTEIDRLRQTQRFLLGEARPPAAGLLGDAPSMRRLRKAIAAVAVADSTVLVIGETGTGKELVAHALHQQSRRADAMLVKLNCAALPGELIESELFGHEKGAFTGATAQRKGRFERADGGTLFLDEVGELTLAAQAKLLRVLQEQEFERVGGTCPLRVDVRVIAAPNRDLLAMVAAGSFRADLYYRLNVFPLRVPPLRERADDVELLAREFLAHQARKLGRSLRDFDAVAWQRLRGYAWPGNVRELQNVVERAAVLATGELVSVEALNAPSIPDARGVVAAASAALVDVEAAHLRAVLAQTGWVIEGPRGAAAVIGLEPSTLRSRLRKLGIRRPAT